MAPTPEQIPKGNEGMTSMQRQFIITYTITFTIATFLVGLRVWTRIKIVKNFGLDDYAVVGAWLMSIGVFVICIIWMDYGFGQHIWNVSNEQIEKNIKLLIPLSIFHVCGLNLSKLSIIILYHRINPEVWFRRVVYAIGFLVSGITFAEIIALPLGRKLTNNLHSDFLGNQIKAFSIFNTITDFLIIVLPLRMVWRLQVSRCQKFALVFMLAGGSFVTIASIIIFIYVDNMANHFDITWTEGRSAIWLAVEFNVALMCNCSIVLNPLLKSLNFGFLRSNTNDDTLDTPPRGRSRTRIERYPSYQMGLASKAVLEGNYTHSNEGRKGEEDDIAIDSSFPVREANSSEGNGHSTRDFDGESQHHVITSCNSESDTV